MIGSCADPVVGVETDAAFSLLASDNGVAEVLEPADRAFRAVGIDRSNPTIATGAPRHAEYATHVVGIHGTVLVIFEVIGLSEICDPVVRAGMVDVVDLVFWPLAMSYQPSKTMGLEGSVSYGKANVAIMVDGPRLPSGKACVPSITARAFAPSEHTGFRRIIDNLPNLNGNASRGDKG